MLPDLSVEKANNVEKLPADTKDSLATRTKVEALSMEGIANDKKLEPVPYFLKAPCETLAVNGTNNQFIVVGRDRPAGLLSGYGGRGDTKCGSIDIVVGRKLPNEGIIDEAGDKIFVNPDFSGDAARIHISQRTDIDRNFQLVDGSVGNSVARSGIGIKADSVRIIGREGIKLVTRADETNSIGGEINRVKGIDLIAGNNTRNLQPMVLGRNLKELLEKMQKDIAALSGMVNSTATKQIALNAALATHTHMTIPDPTSATLIGTLPSIVLAAVCGDDVISRAIQDIPSHIGQQINTTAQTLDYLNPASGAYILSKFNNTN